MSEQEKNHPSHRISFSAFERDREGNNKLGNAREIGAIWPRRDKEGEGILRFDHTPKEDGVYFVRTLESKREDEPKQERNTGRSRDRRER
jgi:hypothetical protein